MTEKKGPYQPVETAPPVESAVVTDDEWPNTTDNYVLHVLILGPLLLMFLFAVGVIGTAIWNAIWGAFR